MTYRDCPNSLSHTFKYDIHKDINKWKARIYYSNYINLKKNYYYSYNFSSYISSKNQPYYLYESTGQIRGYEKYLIYGHSNIIYRNTLKKKNSFYKL